MVNRCNGGNLSIDEGWRLAFGNQSGALFSVPVCCLLIVREYLKTGPHDLCKIRFYQ